MKLDLGKTFQVNLVYIYMHIYTLEDREEKNKKL